MPSRKYPLVLPTVSENVSKTTSLEDVFVCDYLAAYVVLPVVPFGIRSRQKREGGRQRV